MKTSIRMGCLRLARIPVDSGDSAFNCQLQFEWDSVSPQPNYSLQTCINQYLLLQHKDLNSGFRACEDIAVAANLPDLAEKGGAP